MKTVILILLFISLNAFSSNFVSDSHITNSNNGVGPVRAFKNKKTCEIRMNESCRKIDGIDLRTHMPKSVQVNDLNEPLFGPKLKLVSDLQDLSTCRDLIKQVEGDPDPLCLEAIETDGNFNGSTTCEIPIIKYCDTENPGYEIMPVCNKQSDNKFEAYCIAVFPQSYKQKTVIKLMPDTALMAQKQARLDAINVKKAQRVLRKQRLDDSLENWDSLTSDQKLDKLKDLISEVRKK